jgi:hypothetical protein
MRRLAAVLPFAALVSLVWFISDGGGGPVRGTATMTPASQRSELGLAAEQLGYRARDLARYQSSVSVNTASGVSPDVGAAANRSQPLPAVQTGNGTTSTSGSPASTSTSQMLVITEADSGKTFSLVSGARAVLRLTDRFVWTAPHVDGTALRLIPVSYFRDPGYQEWQISVVGTGQATIRSSGTPNCATGATCPEGGFLFAVVIAVSS